MFSRFAKSQTRRLTQVPYALRARRHRPVVWIIAAVIVVACGSAIALRLNSMSPENQLREQMALLMADNLRMKQALEQNTFKVQHETATRAELERQMNDMSAQLKRLQDELNFFRSRKDKTASK